MSMTKLMKFSVICKNTREFFHKTLRKLLPQCRIRNNRHINYMKNPISPSENKNTHKNRKIFA